MRFIWLMLSLLLATVQPAHCAQRDYTFFASELFEDQELDYDENGEEGVVYRSNELCLSCLIKASKERSNYFSKGNHGIDIWAIPYYKTHYGSSCPCRKINQYSGYLHFLYKEDFPFLKKQIAYSKTYPAARIFWPENSHYALNISNVGVDLFERLFADTHMSCLQECQFYADKFMVRSWYFPNLDYLYGIALASSCFHFSDYFQVCQDIRKYAHKEFGTQDAIDIDNALNNLLVILAPLFQEMYEHALSIENMPAIQEELELIQNLYNEPAATAMVCPICQPTTDPNAPKWYCSNTKDRVLFPIDVPNERNLVAPSCHPASHDPVPCAISNNQPNPPSWCQAALYYSRGMLYVDHSLYSEAIQVLTKSLEHDPANSYVLLERAHAYFENGQLDLAMADYQTICKIEKRPVPRFPNVGPPRADLMPLGPQDYAKGLCIGVLEGGYASAEEFGPAMISSARGLLHGLWAFACSPAQVSSEFVQASQDLIEAILYQSCLETLQMVVPEVRDLCQNWTQLPHYDRGRKLGFIIGKYGLDIFIPAVGVKLYGKYRALKAANTLLTLDCMASSAEWNAAMVRAGLMRADAYLAVRQQARVKLILANPNQAKHIVGDHHLWDRVMKLTKCPETDIKRIIAFLEEHNVVCPANLERTFPVPLDKPIKLYDIEVYKKTIGKNRIEVHMQRSLSSQELSLSNAFVINPSYTTR